MNLILRIFYVKSGSLKLVTDLDKSKRLKRFYSTTQIESSNDIKAHLLNKELSEYLKNDNILCEERFVTCLLKYPKRYKTSNFFITNNKKIKRFYYNDLIKPKLTKQEQEKLSDTLKQNKYEQYQLAKLQSLEKKRLADIKRIYDKLNKVNKLNARLEKKVQSKGFEKLTKAEADKFSLIKIKAEKLAKTRRELIETNKLAEAKAKKLAEAKAKKLAETKTKKLTEVKAKKLTKNKVKELAEQKLLINQKLEEEFAKQKQNIINSLSPKYKLWLDNYNKNQELCKKNIFNKKLSSANSDSFQKDIKEVITENNLLLDKINNE